MKMRYDQKDDILMVELSKDKIDFAEQSDNFIVHFSVKKEPVLLEVLDATKFLTQTQKAIQEPTFREPARV